MNSAHHIRVYELYARNLLIASGFKKPRVGLSGLDPVLFPAGQDIFEGFDCSRSTFAHHRV
jgi:hypothetical protein